MDSPALVDDATRAVRLRDALAVFSAVFDRYKSSVLTVLTWYAPDRLEAEELFHSAFVRVGNLLVGPERPVCLSTVVFGAVAHELQERRRHREVRRVSSESRGSREPVTLAGSDPGDLDAVGCSSRLREAVQDLVDTDRITLLLARVARLTPGQVADALDISERTVKRRIARSLVSIANRLRVVPGQTDAGR